MYIEPNTTIKILRGIPFDPGYDHTLYFATLSAQENYFKSMAKYTLDHQSYQRVQKGWMRVNVQAENLYDCNYLMFQNTAFGTKWFYAFIKNVEYVNNAVSQIEFEIDVLQTWHFNYELEACLIDREHAETDVVGDNLVPEDLELGEYVTDNMDGTTHAATMNIVIAATFDSNFNDVGGTIYSGLFSGLEYHIFENSSTGAISAANFIEEATSRGKSDGIVSVFYAPADFITQLLAPVASYTVSKTKLISGAIDGYTPKNKKLYTYPYNFLYVSNLQGKSAVFPYEYFSTSSCNFTMTGDFTANPTIILAPENYKGALINYDEMMTLSGYPQCSYNTDVYKAWLAQVSSALPFSAAGSGISIGAGALATTAGTKALATVGLGAAIGTVAAPALIVAAGAGAAILLAKAAQHAIQPPQAHGTQSGTTLAAVGLLDFCFFHKHIRPEFLRIIDDYFTVYGYACHKVKVPNRLSRPHWNYTKTIGCQIKGKTINNVTFSIPGDDAVKICGIYDKGITFWKNGSEVGNYSLDNSPSV